MSKFLCDACCVFSGIFIRMAHFILLVSEIGKFFSNIRCILFRLVFFFLFFSVWEYNQNLNRNNTENDTADANETNHFTKSQQEMKTRNWLPKKI